MKKVVTFGEVMLRLATPGYLRIGQSPVFNVSFGGGEANVAVSLAQFEVPVSFVTRLPANALGEWCVRELRAFSVDVEHIVWGGERIGTYYLETGANARASQVIYDRAHSAIATIPPGTIDWEQVFEGVHWFHWTGITPAISRQTTVVLKEALEVAEKMGLVISTDLNYRKKLWKWGTTPEETMPDLVKHCHVILGNEEDAAKVFGIHPQGVSVEGGHVPAEAYESVARQLMHRFPKAEKVIITLRGSHSANHNTWSGVLFDGTELLQTRQYDITHIVDRVGGGDSFMAGLIYGLTHYSEDQKALDFAVAASALKHTIYGDFNRVTVGEVEKLMGGDGSGRVVR